MDFDFGCNLVFFGAGGVCDFDFGFARQNWVWGGTCTSTSTSLLPLSSDPEARGGFYQPSNQPSSFSCTSTSTSTSPPEGRRQAQGGFYHQTNQPSYFTCTSTSTSPLWGPGPEALGFFYQPTKLLQLHFDFDLDFVPPLEGRGYKAGGGSTNQPSYFTCTSTSTSPPCLRSGTKAQGGGSSNQPTKLLQLHFDFDFPLKSNSALATSITFTIGFSWTISFSLQKLEDSWDMHRKGTRVTLEGPNLDTRVTLQRLCIYIYIHTYICRRCKTGNFDELATFGPF